MNAYSHSFPTDDARALVVRNKRRQVSLGGFVALADGTTREVTLLDLSYDGCGIEVALDLSPGQEVKLSVPGRGAIEAHVRWYANGKAGLVFAPEVAKPQVKRKTERLELTAEVKLRRVGGAAYRVSVFDLSPLGCRAEVIEQPRQGEIMLIKFDGLEGLEAEARWVEGHRAGLLFEKPIHPAVFDLLLTRLGG
jgi:hypothetical protein